VRTARLELTPQEMGRWRNTQLRVFVTSVAVVMWFYSVTGLIKLLTKGSETPATFVFILSLSLLYLGADGDVSELVGVHDGTPDTHTGGGREPGAARAKPEGPPPVAREGSVWSDMAPAGVVAAV
jgi:hypothetical protein